MSTAHDIHSARLIMESARQSARLLASPGPSTWSGKARPPLVSCRKLELSGSAATLFAEGHMEDRGMGREMAEGV